MVWEILNKFAIIGTILGIPATLGGIWSLLYKTVVVYDMYKEPNEAGGDTVEIGNFTRYDKRHGKKTNNQRMYHRKGTKNEPKNWV